MRGFFIVALLFTVYCSLFTKTLFAIRYWLFTVHYLIANFRILLTGPGQCCE